MRYIIFLGHSPPSWVLYSPPIDGTLLNKRIVEVGDYVERDEELATIETDKVICLPVTTRSVFYFILNLLPAHAHRVSARSISPSTLQRLARSRSFLQMRRTPLLLVRISSGWRPAGPLPRNPKKKRSLSKPKKKPKQKPTLLLPHPRHNRSKKKRLLLLHQSRSQLFRSPPHPNQSPPRPHSLPLETGKSAEYCFPCCPPPL